MSTNDRRAKLKEIIALNTERHNRLQEEEDFEAYYRENILQALDDIVRQVASERAPETSTVTALGQKARISTTMRDFFARFDDTYQSLMEAMFPGLALSAGAIAVPGGTRSRAINPGATGAVAPQDHAQQRSLSPEEAKVRSRLPDWVVVPYAHAPKNRPEYAILWAGEDPAPPLPRLELRLDGQPQDKNVFWLRGEKTKNMADPPRGNVTFVQFNMLRPLAFTISEREDGGLVVDFMT